MAKSNRKEPLLSGKTYMRGAGNRGVCRGELGETELQKSPANIHFQRIIAPCVGAGAGLRRIGPHCWGRWEGEAGTTLTGASARLLISVSVIFL